MEADKLVLARFDRIEEQMDRMEEKLDNHIAESSPIQVRLATVESELRVIKWLGGTVGTAVILAMMGLLLKTMGIV